MDSRVPTPPSQPLHYFDLPTDGLKWKKDGNPGGNQRPLRCLRSPQRRPKTTFSASLLQTLSSGSVSSPPPPPRHQSPVSGNSQTKQAPIRGESSSKRLPSDQESPFVFGGEPNQKLSSGRDLPSKSAPEASKKNTQSGNLTSYRRNFSFDAIKNGAAYSSTSAQKAAAAEKVDDKKKAKGKQAADDDGGIKRSKILIKLPYKNNDNNKAPPPPEQPKNPPKDPAKTNNKAPPAPEQPKNPPKDPAKTAVNSNKAAADQVKLEDQGKTTAIHNTSKNVVDDETKIWNLRPRKTTNKKGSKPQQKKADESSPLKNEGNNCSGAAAELDGEKKGGGGSGGVEVKKEVKNKPPSITIALTKREIEEDIYALTGGKPARRPRRRSKTVQKQLDMVFPGLWL